MSEGKRSRLSLTQRSEIWSRWKSGQSLHEIGRAFGKPHTSIRCLLLPRGGIPPAARCRSRLALTLAEREDISRGIASGSSIREIARRLDRAASTVSREVNRHGGRPVYRAHEADDQAWESALRPKRCLLALHQKLREVVASKLILDWSPEQISGWLKTQYPDDESMRVSHETVYRSLFIQARGVLKKELMDHLRSKRRMRRSRHASVSGQSRGQIVDHRSQVTVLRFLCFHALTNCKLCNSFVFIFIQIAGGVPPSPLQDPLCPANRHDANSLFSVPRAVGERA